MAIRRAHVRGLISAGFGLGLLAQLFGCPSTVSLPNPFQAQRIAPTPAPSVVSQLLAPDGVNELIKGVVMGPGGLGNGTTVVADPPNNGNSYQVMQVASTVANPTQTASTVANPAATASGTTQPSSSGPVYQPVQNADVTIKGYDWRIIPEIADAYTDAKGNFYVPDVPSQVAFFIDVNYTINGTPYRMLGLTRTDQSSGITNVTVDLASTLVARELLRMWQQTNYTVEFKDLSSLDFTPLLLVLEQALKNGVPAGVASPQDIFSNIQQPNGKWTFSQDSQDSALVAIDRIAARNCEVNNEITRLYTAVNLLYTKSPTYIAIPRPSPLPGTPALLPICTQ